MKKIIVLTTAVFIAAFAFSACSKKSSGNTTPAVATSMNATINGTPFTGSLSVFAINNGSLEIDGGNQNTQNTIALQLLDPYIRLYINNYTIGSVGTYTNASMPSNASASIDSNTAMATYVTGSTVTINITKSTSSVISGTFSFTALDMTTVTNGTFTAKAN